MNIRITKFSRIREQLVAASDEADHASLQQFDELAAIDQLDREGLGK